MMENGPCKVIRDDEGVNKGKVRAELAKYGWNNKANVVWVDQPAGVGFSFTDGEEEELMFSHDQVADNMLAFLFRWQERFPDSHNGKKLSRLRERTRMRTMYDEDAQGMK